MDQDLDPGGLVSLGIFDFTANKTANVTRVCDLTGESIGAAASADAIKWVLQG